ncbi:unnamed protein product, partial [Vitis vinifera]
MEKNMGSSTLYYLFMFMRFLVLLSGFHLMVTDSSPSVVQHPLCHGSDSSALLEFKQSFLIEKFASGDPSAYPKVEMWQPEREGSDCCSWDGVECDTNNGHVIGLDLSSSCLYGSINSSSSLFRLVHLLRLDLSDNDFNYSKIPHGVGQLSRLTSLNLSSSRFSGQISSQILELSKLLKKLHLNEVNISSRVPDFHHTSSLKLLALAGTSFSGRLPTSIGNLDSLVELNISSCNFTSGLIPSSLGRLIQLTSLDLSRNSFSGQIPSLSNLKELDTLDLSYNQFIGEIPSWLMNLTRLRRLYLAGNRLEGPIPNELEVLLLRQNKIHGPIPKWLIPPNSTTVSENELSGEIPPSFCNMSSLRLLDFSSNSVSGRIPLCLANFSSSLNALNLGSNNLYGVIPQACTSRNNLMKIDLGGNHLEGQVPTSLGSCLMLEKLDLGNNQINDTFPFWLGALPKLQVLILRSNKFHGEIRGPRTNFGFPKLRIIDISHNGFTGNFPWEYFQSWDAMKILESKHLTYMQMADCIGKAKGLHLLNLSNNALTVQLTFLEFFNVSHNHLKGPIPRANQFSTFPNSSFDGNLGLCGNPLSRDCGNPEASAPPPSTSDQSSPGELDWIIVLLGYGSGLVIGVLMGYRLTTRKHEWFVRTFGRQKRWRRKK